MLVNELKELGLSKREVEVAALVATGITNKEISEKLFVTEKTVKFHLTSIYKKMRLRSRAQLIVWCLPKIHFEEQAIKETQQDTTQTPDGLPKGL